MFGPFFKILGQVVDEKSLTDKSLQLDKHDKAANNNKNNIVVVCRLHYINTLKQELNGTKAYKETSTDEKTIIAIQMICLISLL